jgi:hypothetical protein
MTSHRVVGFLLLATLALGACSGDDRQMAQAFIQEWAIDHADEIALRKLGLSDGNSCVTRRSTRDVVMSQQADDLWRRAAGTRTRNPWCGDEAAAQRLDVRNARANLALQLGTCAATSSTRARSNSSGLS